MIFRLASLQDLPQLKAVYKKIVKNMADNKIQMWDEVYPFEHFEEDIEHKRLYLLAENGEIIAAFAICSSSAEGNSIKWANSTANAVYLNRFGVNVKYLRKGVGRFMLEKAKEVAKSMGAIYLRLLVGKTNVPANNLYIKSGFKKAEGTYVERVDDNFVLNCSGYEIKL